MGKDIGNGVFLHDRQLYKILGYFFLVACIFMFAGWIGSDSNYWFLLPGIMSALCFRAARQPVVVECL